MNISVFDIFSIGIGPSSSHTVGPMKAAKCFVNQCQNQAEIARVQIILYGSLAYTGKGHGTDIAIMMGLEGEDPETVEPDFIKQRVAEIKQAKKIRLAHKHTIAFDCDKDILFEYREQRPQHSNAMYFNAFDKAGAIIERGEYYSIGGGFIVKSGAMEDQHTKKVIPYSFSSADELLATCQQQHLTIAELMWENERVFRCQKTIERDLDNIIQEMMACIERGCHTEGVLPSSLKIKRRAPVIYKKIIKEGLPQKGHPHPMNWLNVFSMAVQEENACGGKVVTAPTNGAAGIIPALIKYHQCFDSNSSIQSIYDFLMTAGAICTLYKKNASISGAEMGCQGEVGVACSMAAAGLTAARGGTLYQVENAAEIGMEHNLGLTCDPVNGLVQVPCIERNGMGAVKAVNASSLALTSTERGCVTLDMVIETMRQVGNDMKDKYKETSKGGLAKNVVIC
jgi:L-serine dehydratase